jgi:hypothetical protein
MFGERGGKEENDLSPLYVSLLNHAPEKQLFLKGARLLSGGWTGSLADIWIRRKAQVLTLADHPDEQVRAWVAEIVLRLDQWIERECGKDRASEESFE